MTPQEEQKFVQGLYDSIFASITSSPDGGQTVFNPDKTFLTLCRTGIIVRAKDFSNPFDPAGPSGDRRALSNLINLIEKVPNFSALWSDSGTTVPQLYETLIHSTVTATSPPDPAQLAAMKRARDFLYKSDGSKTATYDKYQKKQKAWADARSAYNLLWLKYNATEDGRSTWPIIGGDYYLPVQQAWNDWRADRAEEVEAQLAILQTSSQNQIAQAFAAARQLFDATGIQLDGASPQKSHLVRVLPSDWADANAPTQWNDYSFKFGESSFSAHSDFTSWGGGGGFSVGLWSFGGSAGGTTSHSHTEAAADSFEVAFKWSLVTIDRPYMNFLLFGAPHWKTDMAAKGSFSSGKRQGQEATKFPLLPTAFVAIKGLSIKADWSASDRSVTDSSTHGSASVGWGPFSVSGSYSHSEHDEVSHASFADGAITNPDVQIIGWINQIVPFSPPE
jgi:hypothetical protein